MAYSDDDNLKDYYPDIGNDGSFSKYHNLAAAEVDRRLRKQFDWTDAEIATLSTRSKTDVIPACCFYVLYLLHLSSSPEEADRYKSMWEDHFAQVTFELDADSDGTAEEIGSTGGYCVRG